MLSNCSLYLSGSSARHSDDTVGGASIFHTKIFFFLLLEDLAGFELLNSPFRRGTLCLPHLSDSLGDRKRTTGDENEWRVIFLFFLLTSQESVSSSGYGIVRVNTEQMVWSVSKTNTPLVLVSSADRKQGLSVMCDWLSASYLFAPEESAVASRDLIHTCQLRALHLSSRPLFLLLQLPTACFPSSHHLWLSFLYS